MQDLLNDFFEGGGDLFGGRVDGEDDAVAVNEDNLAAAVAGMVFAPYPVDIVEFYEVQPSPPDTASALF